MRMLGSLGLGTLVLVAAGDQAAGTEWRRPSVVIVMVDDMGFSDLGCYGGEIETSHLDRLSKGELRFTQFYNAARCVPTRAALMTGKWQVGSAPQHWPWRRGFDRFFGTPQGGGVYFKDSLTIRRKLHGEIFSVLDDQRVGIPADFYVTDAFTDAAQIDSVDQNMGRLDALGCLDDTLILFLSDNGVPPSVRRP